MLESVLFSKNRDGATVKEGNLLLNTSNTWPINSLKSIFSKTEKITRKRSSRHHFLTDLDEKLTIFLFGIVYVIIIWHLLKHSSFDKGITKISVQET